MDIHYEYNGIIFVWDEEKAWQNRRKHKEISFETAVEAFFDPFLIFIDASRNLEHRDGIIGKTSTNQLLFVVHIQLEENYIRIISARKAAGQEKRTYYEYSQP